VIEEIIKTEQRAERTQICLFKGKHPDQSNIMSLLLKNMYRGDFGSTINMFRYLYSKQLFMQQVWELFLKKLLH
jgi:hypothetical protein